jgi:aspartate/methionine/tyrosine aminotransferase
VLSLTVRDFTYPVVLKTGLINEANIVIESAAFYGKAGEGFMRIFFGSEPDERRETAMDRIEAFTSTL